MASPPRRASKTGRRFASPNRRGKATRACILRWEKQPHAALSSEPAKITAPDSPESFKRRSQRKERNQKAVGKGSTLEPKATRGRVAVQKLSRNLNGACRFILHEVLWGASSHRFWF